jgi:cytochrome c peroxidase
MIERRLLILALAAAGAGCSSSGPGTNIIPGVSGGDGGPGGAPGAEAGSADPPAVFTAEERAALMAMALPADPKPLPDRSNKWSDDPKAALFGQRLFFDTGFSGELLDGDNDGTPGALGKKGDTGKVSCASCHLPESGFVDTRTLNKQISLASGWVLRRTPSLLDVAQSSLIMWDGRFDALYNQVFGPIESAVEMNSSRLFAAQGVFARHKAEYEALFGPLPALADPARFPALAANVAGCRKLDADHKCVGVMRGSPGDGAEYDGLSAADKDAVTRVWVNVGKAIAAYERLLTCGPSRFDRWARGDAQALTRAEQRGAALFAGKGKCVSCHSGPYFSDEKFHNVGLKPTVVAAVFIDSDDAGASAGLPKALANPLNVRGTYSDGDDGRLPAMVGPEHEGAFRTPRLRCISTHPSFMHTAQLTSLDEVMVFFSRGGDRFGYPGKNELQALDFTPAQRDDLVAFLKSLEGPGPDAKLLKQP